MEKNELQEHLKSIFLINYNESVKIEEEGEEDNKDTEEDTDSAADDSGSEDLFGDESANSADDENKDNADSEDEDTEEPDSSEEDADKNLTAEQKIEKLFKDTGVPSSDWSLTNENNIRLAAFKFKLVGVDYESLMTKEEKSKGVPSNLIEQRLSSEEKSLYKDLVSKIREKYPLISKREKNIILWNAKIPILAKTENGNVKNIYEDKQSINEAFEKIDEYLSKKYEDNWQDNKDAINFIRNVKINFSAEKSKITPNLLTTKKINELINKKVIAFNSLNIDTPESVLGFIRDNTNSEVYNASPIFNTMARDFNENGDISRGSLYPILRGTVEEETTDSSDNSDQGEGGAGGDMFGGGDSGGFGEGGPEIGSEDTGGDELDLGGDAGDAGDTGDTGGDELDLGGDSGEEL